MIWRDLPWPCKSPKFNLHHLGNISTGFKMAVLTPKSDILKQQRRISLRVRMTQSSNKRIGNDLKQNAKHVYILGDSVIKRDKGYDILWLL